VIARWIGRSRKLLARLSRKPRRTAIAAAFVVCCAGVSASIAAGGGARPPSPVGIAGRWKLILDDEFAGPSLRSTLWSPSRFAGGSGIAAGFGAADLECFDSSQVHVTAEGLALRLTARRSTCAGRSRPYASAVVSSAGKWSYTYGFVEVRAWLPGGRAIDDWPAIWAVGSVWPRDGELDIVEGLGGRACWHFHNLTGSPGGCARRMLASGWHTFGADWEAGSVTWYYDGRRVGELRAGVTDAPMSLIIDLAAGGNDPGPLIAPAVLRVRYVRVWQR
jgi:beta-glucanase (GH16 family)